jgi:hypothetical protein
MIAGLLALQALALYVIWLVVMRIVAFLPMAGRNRLLLISFVAGVTSACGGSPDSTSVSQQVDTESLPFFLKPARVQEVGYDLEQSIWTVTYPTRGNQVERVRLVPPPLPTAHKGLVSPDWSRPCSVTPGSELMIGEAKGAPYAVLQRPSTAGAEAGAQRWHLCYVWRYFDLARAIADGPSRLREVRFALGISLSLMSEDDAAPGSAWIRGPADDILAMYDDAAVMSNAAATRGQPGLAASVDPIREARSTLQDQIILVQVAPFRVVDPAEKPVGGGWPYFVVTVYVDNPARPTLWLDYSSRLS